MQHDINTRAGARQQMVEVALRRLDGGEAVLRMLYVDNPATPEALRTIFTALLAGEISKQEARSRLQAVAASPDVAVPTAQELGIHVAQLPDGRAAFRHGSD